MSSEEVGDFAVCEIKNNKIQCDLFKYNPDYHKDPDKPKGYKAILLRTIEADDVQYDGCSNFQTEFRARDKGQLYIKGEKMIAITGLDSQENRKFVEFLTWKMEPCRFDLTKEERQELDIAEEERRRNWPQEAKLIRERLKYKKEELSKKEKEKLR